MPDIIAAAATRSPESAALLAPGRPPLSYAALEEHGSSVASKLDLLGISRGDTVAVLLPNGPEAAATFLGVSAAAACAPLNPAYTRAELDFYLGDLAAKLLITVKSCKAALEVADSQGIPILELAPEPGARAGVVFCRDGLPPVRAPSPGDIALLLHTSGTTSRPKLVPLTHKNLAISAANVATTLRLGPADRCLNVMPLFHIHGLVAAVLASLSAGASIVCTPGFDTRQFFEWIAQLEPSWYTAVPTMHQAILARAGAHVVLCKTRPFRLIRSSSAALPVPVLRGLEETFGAPVIEAYGMTEAAHQMTSNPLPPGERRPGSVGLPAGPEIAILDQAGRELPQGSVGEIAIRGENVFGGYAANPEANEAAFAGSWFRTGDEGSIDENGYLVLRGRLKEIINRGGEKISPREVDETLLEHPAVDEAVTFAAPHPRLGEDVAAAVTLRDGSDATEDDVRRFAHARLADFKVPRRVLILDELPKGATGKVQRIGLAERLGLVDAAAGPRPAFRPPHSPLERELAALWAELLEVPDIGLDDDFFALGGDSIVAAELMTTAAHRGWTPGELSPATLLLAPTLGRFAGVLGRADFRIGETALVPLRPDGDREPLFLVHTHEGHVLHYLPVAHAMEPGRPVWALQAAETRDGSLPYRSLEDLAAAHLAEVRAFRPTGPYLLGGVCLGGTIAFEMARQLRAEGERVSLALLVDPTPGPRGPLTRAGHRLVFVRERIELHRERGDLGAWLSRKLRRRGARPPRTGRSAVAPPPATRNRFLAGMTRLRDGYTPGPYDGEIVVFRSPGNEVPCRYWRRVAVSTRCERLRSMPSRAEHDALVAERIDAALAAQDVDARTRARRRS